MERESTKWRGRGRNSKNSIRRSISDNTDYDISKISTSKHRHQQQAHQEKWRRVEKKNFSERLCLCLWNQVFIIIYIHIFNVVDFFFRSHVPPSRLLIWYAHFGEESSRRASVVQSSRHPDPCVSEGRARLQSDKQFSAEWLICFCCATRHSHLFYLWFSFLSFLSWFPQFLCP